MTNAVFNEMCITIRQAWTTKDGVIVKLKRGSDSDAVELLLCVGSYRNPSITARQCVLWEGDEMLYDGELQCAELRAILTRHKICYGELTNARLMEREKHGVYKCFKDPMNCKRKCALCGKRKFQMTEDVTAVLK